MKLASYYEKRNFKNTLEPKGEIHTDSGSNIFVAQKHYSSHLHYDFRLEIDGVLKSWAIPKGISLVPGVKRLAIMTEDHPLEYANFVGIIPEGEYGAGKVEIWDRGVWKPRSDMKLWSEQRKLEFALYGKKLNGTWVLIGLKNNLTHWLLIKANSLFVNNKYDYEKN